MQSRAQAIQDQMVQWRRDFHMVPELGFEEVRTAERVAQVVDGLGYRVRRGVGRTGVVADLGNGGRRIAIRADMDALPIQDEKDVPYASQVPGVMHACGHDAHTAILLGVATLLAQESLPGSVRLLFQPSEEREDQEGFSGARRMIQDGAMDGVDGVLALHVDSSLPVGDVTLAAGPWSAGVDTLQATIIGEGGHGSTPDKVVDPIYLAAHVVLALHGIVSRRMPPHGPAVISIGTIHGGQVDNVIPERVDLSATIRFQNGKTQKRLHAEIVRALGVARAMGGDYEHRIIIGYPPSRNDDGMVGFIRQAATELLGQEHIISPEPKMGAEDFCFFSELAPGAMFGLGARIEGDERRHHQARFDIDEGCLAIGAALLAESALRFLGRAG